MTPLVDYLCKVLRLALREAFSFSAQNLNTYLETSMSTTRSKDRAGLCSFTFANGHRCRSLRSTSHPHLCYYHARKESQARAAEQIGRDISYFFSGRYLSACDLTAVLARLFSAAASGELKPKTASILAYLGQTLLQTIHLAQHEYINAFGTDSWRRVVSSSVNGNSKYRTPPAPQPSDAAQQPLPSSQPVTTQPQLQSAPVQQPPPARQPSPSSPPALESSLQGPSS